MHGTRAINVESGPNDGIATPFAVLSLAGIAAAEAGGGREGPGGALAELLLRPASRRAAAKAKALTAGQLMSTPAVTVHADDSIALFARIMAEHRVERLPVLDEEERLVGIVTRRDVLQVFLRPDSDRRRWCGS